MCSGTTSDTHHCVRRAPEHHLNKNKKFRKKVRKIRNFGSIPRRPCESDPAHIRPSIVPLAADYNDVSSVRIRRRLSRLRVLPHLRHGGTLPFSRKSRFFRFSNLHNIFTLRAKTVWVGLLDVYGLGLHDGIGTNHPPGAVWVPGAKNLQKSRFFHFGGLPRPPYGG